MSIAGKDPSAWNEADLKALCDEQRPESARLEYKRELNLDTPGEKSEAEHDAHALANSGGGTIVYGIEESTGNDGATGAGLLRPLSDGRLYEKLNQVLDDRGNPRLIFNIYSVPAALGGSYLVLDIAGRRRPHQSNDSRYYVRRGTQKRPMSEAEVAEAYRDRLLRELRSGLPLLDQAGTLSLSDDILERIHRGLKPDELALWREETGDIGPPGWMSVVVAPSPAQAGLLDPIRDAEKFAGPIEVSDRWDRDHLPLQYFSLRPTLRGLHSQLPPSDERSPAYLVSMFRDGVMEYGNTLEPSLRGHPLGDRIVFASSDPNRAHDYLQAFAVALGSLGYDGPVVGQITFEHMRDVRLGVDTEHAYPPLHPIAEERIAGDVWRGDRAELIKESGRIVKQVMDLVFLAAGSVRGCWYISANGELLKRD